MLPGTCPEIENRDNCILEVALILGSSKDRSSVSETVALARVAAIIKRLQKVRRYNPRSKSNKYEKIILTTCPMEAHHVLILHLLHRLNVRTPFGILRTNLDPHGPARVPGYNDRP